MQFQWGLLGLCWSMLLVGNAFDRFVLLGVLFAAFFPLMGSFPLRTSDGACKGGMFSAESGGVIGNRFM